MRDSGTGAILYQSVCDPRPSMCLALLTPTRFAKPRPRPLRRTWYLAVTRKEVTWQRADVENNGRLLISPVALLVSLHGMGIETK